MELKKNDTLIFLGDSVTDCGRSPDGVWEKGDGYPRMVDAMFRILHPETRIYFVNKGTSGDQTRMVIDRLQADVLDLKPDAVTLLIGINDVWRFFDQAGPKAGVSAEEYRDNLKKIIEPILASGAKLLVMTPYMIDTNPAEPMRTKMLEYAGICKQVAEEYQLEVLELQPLFEDLLKQGVSSYELSPDRIHPTQKGHMAIALELMKRLKPVE